MTTGTTIKAVAAHGSQGLDGLRLIDLPDPDQPGPGEIRVRIHASSLNYHDFAVAAVTWERPMAGSPCPMAQAWSKRSVRA